MPPQRIIITEMVSDMVTGASAVLILTA